MQNLSHENLIDLHVNELVSKTVFYLKGFALGLVLKQRQRELGNGLFNKELNQYIYTVTASHRDKYK